VLPLERTKACERRSKQGLNFERCSGTSNLVILKPGGIDMTRRDYLTRFQPTGAEPLAEKPISVFLPKGIDAYVRSLPNRAEWLRRAIEQALLRDTNNT